MQEPHGRTGIEIINNTREGIVMFIQAFGINKYRSTIAVLTTKPNLTVSWSKDLKSRCYLEGSSSQKYDIYNKTSIVNNYLHVPCIYKTVRFYALVVQKRQ